MILPSHVVFLIHRRSFPPVFFLSYWIFLPQEALSSSFPPLILNFSPTGGSFSLFSSSYIRFFSHRRSFSSVLFLSFWIFLPQEVFFPNRLLLRRLSNFPDASFKKSSSIPYFPMPDKKAKKIRCIFTHLILITIFLSTFSLRSSYVPHSKNESHLFL